MNHHQHNELSDFMRRIVADACARLALTEADADLHRLPVTEYWPAGQGLTSHVAQAVAGLGRHTSVR